MPPSLPHQHNKWHQGLYFLNGLKVVFQVGFEAVKTIAQINICDVTGEVRPFFREALDGMIKKSISFGFEMVKNKVIRMPTIRTDFI